MLGKILDIRDKNLTVAKIVHFFTLALKTFTAAKSASCLKVIQLVFSRL